MTDISLPPRVLDLARQPPIEDMVLHVLEHRLPEVATFSLLPTDPPFPCILVRGERAMRKLRTDGKAIFEERFSINAYTTDPNGDEAGVILSSAVHEVLRQAYRQNHHVPGLGWVKFVEILQHPTREADWATAIGPVQYADLPTGVWRYESQYSMRYRAESHFNPNADIGESIHASE